MELSIRKWITMLALAMITVLAVSVTASAAVSWRIDGLTNTNAAPNADTPMLGQITNTGDEASSGPYSVVITLPPHVTGVSATLGFSSCTAGDGVSPVSGASVIRCDASGSVGFRDDQLITASVHLDGTAAGVLTATMEVSGGGALDPATTFVPFKVSPTLPEFGIDNFDGQVNADAARNPFTQAAGHPYDAAVSIEFNTITDPRPSVGPVSGVEAPKDVIVDLPPGLVGSPRGVAQCRPDQLANNEGTRPRPLCPSASQVGTALIRLNGIFFPNVLGPIPVYNMEAPPDVPARFSFNVLGSVVSLNASLRSGSDYGLTITSANIPEAVQVAGTTVTLWGVPSDRAHDGERACQNEITPFDVAVPGPTCRSSAPRKAFIRLPTSCPPPGEGLLTTVRSDSWQDPGDFKTDSFLSHLPPAFPLEPEDWGTQTGTTNCAAVPFNPTLSAEPMAAEKKAGAPAGFQFDLELPQTDDPDVIGQADLKKAVVRLPAGLRVLPASATGLAGCSSAQVALRSTGDPTCPEASKIGTLTIDTPLIEQQLRGSIYLATPFDNPTNSLIAMYLVARGPGVIVKLPGSVALDANTGEITATFDDNPQLPFSRLHLEFNSGSRAPLAMPRRCGTYTTHAEMEAWSGAVATSDSSFTLTENARGEPCPSTFTPDLKAGTTSPSAGESSDFLLSLFRDDEDQELSTITVNMPQGLLGRIALMDLCSANDANAGTCGPGSRIGNVTVGAGAGPTPFYITNGNVYITGPYKGAPFGLSFVVPAKAGPFDLGTVIVRSSIFVDKHDATLRIVSEPLPTILQGIPLDVRDVRVTIDREGFFLNPTSCAEKTISATVGSTEGATANLSTRFQAADCASLGLRPRMSVVVGGPGFTSRAGSTPLTTTLRPGRGDQANLRFVQVTLPMVINARLPVINRACTRDQYEAGNCRGAMAGTAEVVTPLLREPLRGGVFFVKNGNPLPDMFIALRGQVRFDLIGRVSIPGSVRLRTTFERVPDVPFSRFTLRLVAGRQGPVGTAANLCTRQSRRAKAELDFRGQNGKVAQIDQRLTIRGCDKPGKRGKGTKSRRR